MTRLDKARNAFVKCNGNFPFTDFKRLLRGLGYVELSGGKTRGSRRKYYSKSANDVIMLDEPHDGIMTRGMVKRLQKHLRDKGIL